MIECYICGELSECELCYNCQEKAFYEGWDEVF